MKLFLQVLSVLAAAAAASNQVLDLKVLDSQTTVGLLIATNVLSALLPSLQKLARETLASRRRSRA
jgi:hypothetical protein